MASPARPTSANAPATGDGATTPVQALLAQGQSLWLDYITRDLVRGGELQRLIEDHGIRGETSNPTIFGKAIATGTAYDEQMSDLVAQGIDANAIFEALAVTDIQDACDLFRPLYDRTAGLDGFVSIEVSPGRAHDTEGTLVEARRLWRSVARPNVMVKVPGTSEGAPAVEQLLAEGININITLLFSRRNHERVMQAYLDALEQRVAAGQPIERLASVASFFVSRVDTLVDALLEEKIAASHGDDTTQERLRGLRGTAAIANAKLAYARFREIFEGDRFRRLKEHGARLQRPLWASTGTKNPAYSDVLYIEQLIGPDTINTLPQATLEAFEEHGQVRRTLDDGLDEARATMDGLQQAGIDLDAVTQQLEDEGVASFTASYNELIAVVEQKRQALQPHPQGEH
jgi:transaldolase